ncbi:TPA: type III-B CRISPR module RAMP protein Cmr6 [Streptococcus suis]
MNQKEIELLIPKAYEILLENPNIEKNYQLYRVQLATFGVALAMGNWAMASKHFGYTEGVKTINKKDSVHIVRKDILFMLRKLSGKKQPKDILNEIAAFRQALLFFDSSKSEKIDPLEEGEQKDLGRNDLVAATASRNLSYRFYAGNIDSCKEILRNLPNQVDNPFKDLLNLCGKAGIEDGISYNAQTGFGSFTLEVTYPGLTTGLGLLYENASEEGIKSGFSLDYNTGLPFIQGSNVKGRLRSIMEKLALVESPSEELPDSIKQDNLYLHLGRYQQGLEGLVPMKLIKSIFGGQDDVEQGQDIFFDAFADRANCLAEDFVTRHDKNNFLEPVPVRFLRIKPDTKLTFLFKVSDYEEGEVSISAMTKLKLFRSLLMEYGIGAKTNKGYGYFR